MISDARARTIAAAWHDGRDATYQFSSTGLINALVRWAWTEIWRKNPDNADLDQLHHYLAATPDRGPQDGWGNLWEEPAHPPLIATAGLWCPYCKGYTAEVHQLALWQREQHTSVTGDTDDEHPGTSLEFNFDWTDDGEYVFHSHQDWHYGCCNRVIELATQVEALNAADGR